MDAIISKVLAAVRTSEFWALAGQAYVEAVNAPVPDEMKWAAWTYIALRIAGKLAKFIFPAGEAGKWFAND